jgi:Circularly permutated YpsA SLOG family
MLAPAKNDLTFFAILALVKDTSHPFSQFIREELNRVTDSFYTHNIGAIVTGGQTGVELAALRLADRFEIPSTGFAPLDLINDTGEIPAEYRSGMFTQESHPHLIPPDLLLSDEVIRTERVNPPYKRDKFYSQMRTLNFRASSATLLLCNSSESPEKYLPEFGGHPDLQHQVYIFHMDTADRVSIGDARWWIKRQCPVLLHITGPTENYTIEGGKLIRETASSALYEILATSHSE